MRVARYIVYGAGGIGATLGAELQKAGARVLFVARGEQLRALRERGLEYATPGGRERFAVDVAGGADEIGFRPGDVVLLAAKTQDTLPIVEALARVASPDLPVLCAQNGVENERIALRRFRTVLGLAVWVPASFLAPGVVSNYSVGAPIEIGRYPAGAGGLAADVAADLVAAGFAAEARACVMTWKHAKLLTNAVSTLDGLCGGRAGLDDLAARIEREGQACYRAAGIETVAAAEYAARVAFAIERMGEIAGAPRSGGSITQSFARGADSVETDYVNGELVLLGRRHGVATPVNELVARIASELAAKRRPWPLSAEALRAEIGEAAWISD